MFTPPQTPGHSMHSVIGPPSTLPSSVIGAMPSTSAKREAEGSGDGNKPQEKKRRIQPTLLYGGEGVITVQTEPSERADEKKAP